MKLPARPPYEAPMRRVGDRPGSTDRQAELVRFYYPSGQIQGERWKFRERYSEAPQEEAAGCLAFLADWVKNSIVCAFLGFACYVGYWMVGDWRGWVLGSFAIGLFVSLRV